MLTLVLIRHSEAQYRDANGSYVPDGALTRRGAKQAKALTRPLRELRIDLALTSPCRRTRQTAALAGLETTVHDDLAEWRYGPYTRALSAGTPEADDPWWIWQQATVLRRDEPETLGHLVERVDRVLGHIATAVGDDAVAVVVSHGHLLRVLTARCLGLPVLAAAQLQLLPASIGRLTESAGHWSLTTWNSTPSVTAAA